jgi:hypothetical protein
MACNQTLNGLLRDCEGSVGGIAQVLLANFDDVTGVTVSDDIITAISMANSAKFKKYDFRPNTGSMTSTMQRNLENGSLYWQTDLVLAFSKMETVKRIEINAMAINDMVAIVKDMNGKYWYLGKDEPIIATAGDGQTGTARADRNGYGITLQDNSRQTPFEVDESIIDALIA